MTQAGHIPEHNVQTPSYALPPSRLPGIPVPGREDVAQHETLGCILALTVWGGDNRSVSGIEVKDHHQTIKKIYM